MQIDIMIGVGPDDPQTAVVTLESIVLDCDVDCRLVVLMHGATRQNFIDLDEFLAARAAVETQDTSEGAVEVRRKAFDWHIIHVPQKLSFTGVISHLAAKMVCKLAVLVEPGLFMCDEKWFGKLQRPFTLDPHTMLTFAEGFTNSNTPPVKPLPRVPCSGPLIMGSLDFSEILASCVGGRKGFAEDLRKIVKKRGGTRWIVNSIRHEMMRDECPDQLEDQQTVPFA